MKIDLQFIERVEKAHFRTTDDTGANSNVLLIWNMVREQVGLPRISISDLPTWNGSKYEMPKTSKLLTNQPEPKRPIKDDWIMFKLNGEMVLSYVVSDALHYRIGNLGYPPINTPIQRIAWIKNQMECRGKPIPFSMDLAKKHGWEPKTPKMW